MSVEHGGVMDGLGGVRSTVSLTATCYRVRIHSRAVCGGPPTPTTSRISPWFPPPSRARRSATSPGSLDAYAGAASAWLSKFGRPRQDGYDIYEKLPDYQQRGDLEDLARPPL